MKEEIKKLIRFLAPKNNKVTREIADKLPYVVLGMALGAVLLYGWVGQPATMKGRITTTGSIGYISPNDNATIGSDQGPVPIENGLYFSGKIEPWPGLREHIGETVAFKIVVLNAATIEYKGDNYSTENENELIPKWTG
ncbi:MAG: hypothetical protein ABEJ72_05390 [Candidatus Aenigmatarchaeota archaeon]